jgi:hypothetical protein
VIKLVFCVVTLWFFFHGWMSPTGEIIKIIFQFFKKNMKLDIRVIDIGRNMCTEFQLQI